MTKTVIEMAREADMGFDFTAPGLISELERFAALVRADAIAEEREAQIREVDWTSLMRQGGLVTWGDAEELGDRVVATIRARGEASIRSNT